MKKITDPAMGKAIGANIKKLRKQNKYTQQELAEKLDITQKAVSSWENGHTVPHMAYISQMAELFGVEASKIYSTRATERLDYYVQSTKGTRGTVVEFIPHLQTREETDEAASNTDLDIAIKVLKMLDATTLRYVTKMLLGLISEGSVSKGEE